MAESAALAYYTVFSLAPVLLVVVSASRIARPVHGNRSAPQLLLLLWVYYASFIVLFGAEFTHADAKLLEEHVTPPEAGAGRQPRKRSA